MTKAIQRRSTPYQANFFGKVPPQAVELEVAVLGGCLLDTKSLVPILGILKGEYFYREVHQVIFQGISDLYEQGVVPDILSLTSRLRQTEQLDLVGGPFFITHLTNNVVSTANLETFAYLILQAYMKRKAIEAGLRMVSDAYQDGTDIFELLNAAETALFQITSPYNRGEVVRLEQPLAKQITHIQMLTANDLDITGFPTGYHSLDRLTGGWQPGDLVIIAARPSQGKSSISMNLARCSALDVEHPTPSVIFSLEMSKSQVIDRLIACETGINLSLIRRGKVNDNDLQRIVSLSKGKLIRSPIFIDDTAAITLYDFRAKLRKLVKKNGVRLVIFDYFQLAGTEEIGGQTRDQALAKICRGMKQIAKDMEVCIILLAQLNRDYDKPGQRSRKLSQIRECGASEGDADMVAFVEIENEPDKVMHADLPQYIYNGGLYFLKNRNGPCDSVPMIADMAIQKWYEPEQFRQLKSDTVSIYNDLTEPQEKLPF